MEYLEQFHLILLYILKLSFLRFNDNLKIIFNNFIIFVLIYKFNKITKSLYFFIKKKMDKIFSVNFKINKYNKSIKLYYSKNIAMNFIFKSNEK